MLTQQTCNQTYCESAGFHVSNVRMAVNRSVVGQTTFSTSEEVGRALVGAYPFLLDRQALINVLGSDLLFVWQGREYLGDNLMVNATSRWKRLFSAGKIRPFSALISVLEDVPLIS